MVEELKAESLTIGVQPGGDDNVLFHWRGRSNSQHPEKVLDPYLSEAVDMCVSKSLVMEMHFEELEYFNSSTLSSVIRFIRYARDRNVAVSMVYDATRKWQKLGFDALKIFAEGAPLTFKEV